MNSEVYAPTVDPHQSIPHVSKINLQRCKRWHELASWSLSDWGVALAGEVGELCNVVKKLNRVRDGMVGNKETESELQAALRDEIADVYIYLDLFTQRIDADLSACVKEKFNKTSERLGFPDRL